MKTLLSTAYWPNLQYFYFLLNSENPLIEGCEHYQKQSFRNRCSILTANGVLDLIIPVHHNNSTPIKDVRISYKEQWQRNHWRAICSAYKNSPYFEFFEEEIAQLYSDQTEFLFDYNLKQLTLLYRILRLPKNYSITEEFISDPGDRIDLRNIIHPKTDFKLLKESSDILKKNYYQTFSEKFQFTPNLSILDLLFNTGLESTGYLKK